MNVKVHAEVFIMAMKKIRVYSDQDGRLYYITSYKKALSFFKSNNSIDTFTFVKEMTISEAKLKEMRSGCDGEHEYLQPGVCRRKW